MKDGQLEEKAFRQLLQRASQPEPPAGSEDRLLARMGMSAHPAGGNVVPLRKAPPGTTARLLAIAMPLAASLVLGILIGSDSMLDSFLPDSLVSLVQPTGLELDLPELFGDADTLDGDLA